MTYNLILLSVALAAVLFGIFEREAMLSERYRREELESRIQALNHEREKLEQRIAQANRRAVEDMLSTKQKSSQIDKTVVPMECSKAIEWARNEAEKLS